MNPEKQPVDPIVEAEHQARAAEVDKLVDGLLRKLIDLEFDDRTVIAGASSALTRFTMNSLIRAGDVPLPRNVLGRLMRLIQFAAEKIYERGETAEAKPRIIMPPADPRLVRRRDRS